MTAARQGRRSRRAGRSPAPRPGPVRPAAADRSRVRDGRRRTFPFARKCGGSRRRDARRGRGRRGADQQARRLEALVPGHRLQPVHQLPAVPLLLPVRRLRRLEGQADRGAEGEQLQDRLPRLLARLPRGGDPLPEVQGRPDQRRRGQRRRPRAREDEGRHLGAARRRHLRGAAPARASTRKSRFASERDDARALEERKRCLAKLQAGARHPARGAGRAARRPTASASAAPRRAARAERDS